MEIKPLTIHACAIVLGNKGLLIKGPSGSGKSSLAAGLIDLWQAQNRFARWVSDDRVLLEHLREKLIAIAPDAIAGLSETRFGGIEHIQHQPRAVVDLVVDIVPEDQLERLPSHDDADPLENGVRLPRIRVPSQNVERGLLLVEKHLTGRFLNPDEAIRQN